MILTNRMALRQVKLKGHYHLFSVKCFILDIKKDRYEHMHLTLKKEATKPAAENFLQQQGKFDHFIEQYNCDRPFGTKLSPMCPVWALEKWHARQDSNLLPTA